MKKIYFAMILLLSVFVVSNALAQNDKDDLLFQEALDKGYDYLDNNKYDEAFTEFNVVIKLQPNNYVGYAGRALVYHSKGNYEKEIPDLTKVIELNPKDNQTAYGLRAYAYNAMGNIDQAILDYTKAIEQDPGSKYAAEAYNNLALAYYAKHDYAKALENMRKAESLGKKVDQKFIQSLERKIS